MSCGNLGASPTLSDMSDHLTEKLLITEIDLPTDSRHGRVRLVPSVGDESNIGATGS